MTTPHLTESHWTCPVCDQQIRIYTESQPHHRTMLAITLYAEQLLAHISRHLEEARQP
jgi:queuine/archaeosine tRNA-ribosyltransferase